MKVIISFIVLVGLAQGQVAKSVECSTSTIRYFKVVEVYDTLCGKERTPCKGNRYVIRKQPCCKGYKPVGNRYVPKESTDPNKEERRRVKRSHDVEHYLHILDNPCWPDDNHDRLFCDCPPGFTSKHSNETNGYRQCRLAALPNIATCKLKGIGGMHIETKSGINSSCQVEEDVYLNFVPTQVNFTSHISFNMTMNYTMPRGAYKYGFGLVSGSVRLLRKFASGAEQNEKNTVLGEYGVCDQSFNQTNPLVGLTECSVKFNASSTVLNNGDWLCVALEAEVSGYIDATYIRNATYTYNKTSARKTLCLRYDNSPPEHCSVRKPCKNPVIQVQRHITKTSNIVVSVLGWFDPVPANSTGNGSSGIEKMTLTLHETHPSNHELTVSHKPLATFDVTKGSANVTLPRDPALYVLVLEVTDGAQNVRKARTLVLFDNSSRIQLNKDRNINVTSASLHDNIYWQNSDSEFCLSWKDRFYTHNDTSNFLLPLQPDPTGLVSSSYEFSSPQLPSNGTDNVHGVTSVNYSVKVNSASVQLNTTLTNLQQQGTCFKQATRDGDVLEVTVMASDVIGNVKSDTVGVFVDRSSPKVTMKSAIPGLETSRYFFGSKDLSKLVVSLEAVDPHSGLINMRWTIGHPESPGSIGKGTWPVSKLKGGDSCPSETPCYCPTVGACEFSNYSLSMEKLIHTADHNREYLFTITAMNGAGLQNQESLNILVDTSPPERGVVWEGTRPPIKQDEDFTSSNTIHVRWSGFLDHESEIFKYRVAVGRRCLTAEEVSSAELTSNKGSSFPLVLEVTDTTARFSLNAEGRFYSTVIAYNKALMTSQPVCSDGIIRDVTPPVFHNVTLRGSGTKERFVCLSNNAYLLQRNASLVQLNILACAERCQNTSGAVWLSVLPKSIRRQSDGNETESSCERFKNLSPKEPVLYLPNSNIYLDWNLEEDESQIQETLVGFGTAPSFPDLEDFRPTLSFRRHHHNHEGLPTTSPVYVFLRATNKAGVTAEVTLGPLVVDETPPRVLRRPLLSSNSSAATLVIRPADFQEGDEDLDALEISIHLGHVGESSMLSGDQHVLPDICPSSTEASSHCYSVSMARLRQLFGEEPPAFFFSVHIRDLAGHVITTHSDPFHAPSLLPPGQGRVFDLDPDNPMIDQDVDFQMAFSQKCMSWEGFRTHDDVTIYVGIGTAAGKDDVKEFSRANSDITRMCVNNLHLMPHVRYMSTVKAVSTAGTTVVSSDGVTVLEPSSFPSLLVWDGLGCRGKVATPLEFVPLKNTEVKATVNNLHPGVTYTLASLLGSDFSVTSADVVWLPSSQHSTSGMRPFLALSRSAAFLSGSKNMSLGVLECIEDLSFSFENSMSAHWNFTLGQPAFPIRFSVSLLENKCLGGAPRINCMDPVLGFRDVGNALSHIFDEVVLVPDATYHVAVRPCYGGLCGNASLSDGFLFQPHPALTSAVTLSRQNTDSSCLTFTLRWNPFTCGTTVAAHYHVTMTEMDDLNGQQSTILSRTLTVSDNGESNIESKCQQSEEDSSKVVRGCVTGVCLSGQEATACHLLTPDLSPSPLRDLDASRASPKDVTGRHSNGTDETLTAKLPREDVNFVRARVTLAAFLDLQLEGQLDWLLLRGKAKNTEQCSDNPDCLHWTQTSGNFATFPELMLEDGQRYQICAKSLTTAGSHDNKTSSSVCSDGFRVDDVPPSAPQLRVVNAVGGFVRSLSTVHIRWSDVTDLDLRGREEGASGIAFVAYSVGIREGNADLHPWTTTLASSALLKNLTLFNGLTCYANLKVTDRVGLTRQVSEKFIVDTTPPTLGHVTVGDFEGYIMDDKVEVRWGGFRDSESGVRHFLLRVSSVEGLDDVFPTEMLQGSAASLGLDHLVDGHGYRVEVSAVNGVGLKSTLTYDVVADTSPPTPGYVKTRVTTQGGRSRIAASWDKFQDVHSGLSFYRAGIGTKPSLADVHPLSHVGLQKSWTLEQNLRSGGKYYVIVEACNGAGLCVTSSSLPLMVDSTPPIPGVVLVGHPGVESRYLHDSTTLTARWLNFIDPHSGIANYQWCLGTTPTLCDVIDYVHHFRMTSLLHGNLTLPVNTDLYLRVEAFNNVGLSCIGVSDRFRVDTTPPVVRSPPVFLDPYSKERRVLEFQWEDSVLVVDWSVADEDSPVVSQHFTVWAHGSVQIHESLINYGVGRLGPYVIRLEDQKRLAPGDDVRVNVTACNAAGLCTRAASLSLLVDSSPPTMGGFLPRLSWMSASTFATVSLSWYGFEDAESGIRRFHARVGRGYSDSLLRGGTVVIDNADNATVVTDNATIPLNTGIAAGDFLVLTIWAENGVGLRSSVAKATVEVIADDVNGTRGLLSIQRHSCDRHYCMGDCTCAVVGGKCPPPEGNDVCQEISASEDVNVTLTPTGGNGKVTASSSCLSARWSAVPKAERYEWSAALETNSGDRIVPGFGVFIAPEQVWHNAERLTSFVHCLLPDRSMSHGLKYVAYIRVWYSPSSYHVFTSPPLAVDITPPTLRPGTSVSTTLSSVTSSPDHRYENGSLDVAWPRLFLDSQSNVTNYDVMVGSHSGGDDVVPAVNVGSRESYTVNVTLHEGVLYHVTVVARNGVGLMTSHAALPLLLDDEPPISGVIFTSVHYRDAHAQSNTSSLGVSWHGFVDRHSAIARYLVAVGDVQNPPPSPSDFRSVTMATTARLDGLSLRHGHEYRAYIRAVDTASHMSKTAVSNTIRVDTTPAKAIRCNKFKRLAILSFHDTGTRNSTPAQLNASIEQPPAIKSGFGGVIIHLIGGEMYQLTFSGHAHLLHEGAGLTLHLDPVLDPAPPGHTSSITLSPILDEELTLLSHEGEISWPRVVNVSRCASSDVTISDDASNAVHMTMTSPRHAHVSLHVTDPESGVERVMMGLGTREGGLQIQPLTPISGHVMLLPAGLPSATPIYVTAYVENAAGLAVTFTSPIVLDVTPPEVTVAKVKVIEAMSAGSSKVAVAVAWSAQDSESHVTGCMYAVGLADGSTSLVEWTPVSPNEGRFHSTPFTAQHGDVLVLTLWCRNALNLDRQVTSGPLAVDLRPLDRRAALVEMVADNPFSVLPEPDVQPVGGLVRMRWEGFGEDDVTGYQCKLSRDGAMLLNWTDVGLRNYMAFNVGQLQENALVNITGEVRSYDGYGQYSLPGTSSLVVDTRAAELTGSSVVSNLTTPSSLLLDWSDVFSLPRHQVAHYSLALGRRQGASDLLPPFSVPGRTFEFPVPALTRLGSVHVTIRATLSSGLTSVYAGLVSM